MPTGEMVVQDGAIEAQAIGTMAEPFTDNLLFAATIILGRRPIIRLGGISIALLIDTQHTDLPGQWLELPHHAARVFPAKRHLCHMLWQRCTRWPSPLEFWQWRFLLPSVCQTSLLSVPLRGGSQEIRGQGCNHEGCGGQYAVRRLTCGCLNGSCWGFF